MLVNLINKHKKDKKMATKMLFRHNNQEVGIFIAMDGKSARVWPEDSAYADDKTFWTCAYHAARRMDAKDRVGEAGCSVYCDFEAASIACAAKAASL